MEFIKICIQCKQLSYFNFLGLAIGIMLFVFPYKLEKIWNRVLCIYIGGIAGFILGVLFFENGQGALIGCIGGIAISVLINYVIEAGQLFIVSSFALSKLAFILIMLYVDDITFTMFFVIITFCMALGYIVCLFCRRGEFIIWLYAIFAVLELSANILAVFRYESLILDKFLYDKNGIVRFFLYLLKVDFSLSDYQWPFIFLIICLGVIEIILYKIQKLRFQI